MSKQAFAFVTRLSTRTCVLLGLAMAGAAALAVVARPDLHTVEDAPSLSATIPEAFGDWRVAKNAAMQISVSEGTGPSYRQPYDQTLLRTYVNGQGEVVMLALAWGKRQRQDVKVHRPEVCYPAQGFKVQRLQAGAPLTVPGQAQPITTKQMLAGEGRQLETVRYWIRLGDRYESEGIGARLYILQEGLQGRIPDGILVRASQRIGRADDAPKANALLDRFLVELTQATPPETRALLAR